MIVKINKKLLILMFFIALGTSGVSVILSTALNRLSQNQKQLKLKTNFLPNSSLDEYEKNIFSERNTNQEEIFVENNQKQNEEIMNSVGYFSAKIVGENNKFSLNDEIEILIIGQTENINVSAFDIIFNYQKENFDLISETELIKDFDLIKLEKGNSLIIRGVKKPGVDKKISFTEEKIISLRLKPKKKGSFEFGILPYLEKEKTQFIDNQSKIYYPKTSKISIEIY